MFRRPKQSKQHSFPDFHLETLETRILFSADAALNALDFVPEPAAELVLFQKTESGELLVDVQAQVAGLQSKELVILDSDLPDLDTLLDDLLRSGQGSTQVLVLDSSTDALSQITEILAEQRGLTAIHVISHGSSGVLELGGQRIQTLDLLSRAEDVASWRSALVPEADILLYGCEVAADGAGRQFVDTIARLTGADVGASSDLTGSTDKGGDWQLEYQRGNVESQLAVSAELQASFSETLMTRTVTQLIDSYIGTNDIGTSVGAEAVSEPEAVAFTDRTDTLVEASLISRSRVQNDASAEETQASTIRQTIDVRELVFVDTDTVNYQQLVDDLINQGDSGRQFEVFVLDNSRDGIEQISEVLAKHDSLDAVHIISHGFDGALDIGSTRLDSTLLSDRSDEFAAWGDAFDVDGDLLIYGCDLASTIQGQNFVDSLARITGTDVAASIDLTGHATLGGDWDLEYRSGEVEHAVAASAEIQDDWSGLLAPVDLTTTSTTEGGLSINQDGGNDVYLIADNAAFWTGDRLTAEVQVSGLQSSSTASVLFSNAHASGAGDFRVSSGGILAFAGVTGSVAQMQLFDGGDHTIAFSWNGTSGVIKYYVDGVHVDSATGASGTLANGEFIIGQDQDILGGAFDSGETLVGQLRDVRFFNVVRTDSQMASSYKSTLPFNETDMVANWRFDDLSVDGVVTEVVSGNNLTVQHVVQSGFTASEARLTFSADESALDGTVVGSVAGVDAARDAQIASLLAADSDLRYSAETGKFYKVVAGSFDWNTAKSNAESTTLSSANGQLATIRSAYENAFVREIANASFGAGSVFLGGTDAAVEGEWRWVEGGDEADKFWDGGIDGFSAGQYSNWLTSSQPNNSGDEDAIRLDSADGIWYDSPTTGSLHNYVIEWNADDVLDDTNPLVYSINSQTVAGAFTVNVDNGQITVADGSLLDYESNATQTLNVRVTSGDGNTHDEAFAIYLLDFVESSNAPSDLSNGIELNTDGGNDAYLKASDGSALLGGLTAFTLETSFSLEDHDNEPALFSYYVSSDEIRLRFDAGDHLRLKINNTNVTTSNIYSELFDGERHHVAVSWDNTNGDVTFYIDGKFAERITGLEVGHTIATGGDLAIGNDQDGSDSGYKVEQTLFGTLYDIRVWDEVRSVEEIALNQQHKFDGAALPSGLIANWQMDGFDGSAEVVDIVSGNNLGVSHASGTGFIASTPVEDLHIAETAIDGAIAGFAVPGYPDINNDVVRDGLFLDAAYPGTYQIYTAPSTFGSWVVESGEVELLGSVFAESPLGGRSVDLNETSPGSISQSLTVEAGRQYQVIFALTGNHTGGEATKDVRVSVDGQSEDFSHADSSEWSTSNPRWDQRSFTFTADDTTAILRFQSLDSGVQGAIVADVQVIEISQDISTILNNDQTLSYDAGTGKFYRFIDSPSNFATASSAAIGSDINGISGQLVTIGSAYENELIRQNVFDSGNEIWLGAEDDNIDGDWNWFHGSEVGEQFWTGGDAGSAIDGNYASGMSLSALAGETRIRLVSNGNWADHGANNDHAYVIEWDAREVLSSFAFSLADASNNFDIDSSTGKITVAATNTLDYESNTSHDIDVTVVDASGQSYVEAMRITVDNQLDANQSVPGAQIVNEDEILIFTGANQVSVSDSTGGTNTLMQVALSVNDGVLTLDGLVGITIVEGGQGSSSITFNGTESDINAALDGMTFTPDADFNGNVTLDMSTALAADLEVYYTFTGGNADDQSAGTVHNGTLVGGVTTIVDGTRVEVLNLDGVDDHVSIVDTFNDPANVTLSAWVNLSSADADGAEIISLGDSLVLRADDTTVGGLTGFYYDGSDWIDVITTDTVTLAGTGWNHVAYVFDDANNTHALYLNGTLIESSVASGSISYTLGTDSYIGAHANGNSLYDFNGLIDDARVYSRALSIDEIAALASDQAEVSDSVAITVDAVNDAATIENGFGNFIGEFDGSTSTSVIGKQTLASDNLIAVDPSQTYDVSVTAFSGDGVGGNHDPATTQYLGFFSYDTDGERIHAQHVGKVASAVDTTLAVDLVAGATEIVLSDANGWYEGNAGSNRSFAWYGYTNSLGETYADYTYTRNVRLNLWDENAIDGNIITLRNEWTGPTILAGDAVRNMSPIGGTYQYPLLSLTPVSETPTEFSTTLGGAFDSGSTSQTLFRQGTVYISPLALANFTNGDNNQLNLSDFTINSSVGATVFTEDEGPVAIIDEEFSLTDPDDTYAEGLTVTLSGGKAGDIFRVDETTINGLGISVSGVPADALTGDGTITLTLSSNVEDSVAFQDYENALRAITFENISDDPDTSSRTISFVVDDGTDESTVDTLVMQVKAVDDAPVVSVVASSPIWTENASPVGLFSSTSIDPVEAGELVSSLVFTVDGIADGAKESLIIDGESIELTDDFTAVTNTLGYDVAVTVSGSTATVSISDESGISASAAEILVDNLLYDNTSEAPSGTTRTVTLVSVSDSDLDGVNDTTNVGVASSVVVTGVNDAPVLDNTGHLVLDTITEDETSNIGNLVSEIIASDGGDRITDADTAALEGIGVMGVTNSNGKWQFNTGSGWTDVGIVSTSSSLLLRASDSLRFVPDGLDSDVAHVTFSAWDQTSGTVGSKVDASSFGGSSAFSAEVEIASITVSAVADSPVATGNTVVVNEDTPLIIGPDDFKFSDAEDDDLASVTITGLNLNGGTLTHSAGGVTVNNGMTVTAAELADLTFISAFNDSTDSYFTYTVNDAGTGVTSAVMNITVNALNDAPVLTSTGGSTGYTENANPTFVDAGLTISDVDVGDFDGGSLTVTISVNGTVNDQLTIVSGGNISVSGKELYQSGVLVGTFSGGKGTSPLLVAFNVNSTASIVQEVGRQIVYFNTSDDPVIAPRTIDFVATDGDGGTGNTTQKTLSVTAVADAPIAVDDRASLTFDGVDDYINVGSDASLEITGSTLTLEAWVKPAAYNAGNGSIVLNREGEYEIGISDTGALRWAFTNTNPGWAWHETGFLVPLDNWSHLAVSNDNGIVSTFVNGTLVDFYEGSGSLGDAHADKDEFHIGGRMNGAAGQYFNGQIADVRLWDIARSEADILASLNQELPAQAGLIGNWELNEGSGSTAADSAGSNDGALTDGAATGAPLWNAYGTDQDSTLNIDAINNDTDGENDTLTIDQIDGNAAAVGIPVVLSSGAEVTLMADGSVDYDPAGAFDSLNDTQTASDSFVYRISDGNGGTDTATVHLSITGLNDIPVATGNTVTADEDVPLVIGVADFNFNDAENDLLVSVTITDLTLNGGTLTHSAGAVTVTNGMTVTAAQLADLTFISAFNDSTNSSFTYTVNDGGSGITSAVMDIIVNAVNDAPMFVNPELIDNGTFDTNLSGWTTSVDVQVALGELRFGSGDKVGPHTISQSIDTIIGSTYELSFDYRDGSSYKNQSLQVSVDGSSNLLTTSQILTDIAGTTFVRYTYSFTADSNSAIITFTDTSDTANVSDDTVGVDNFLDNVSIRNIPGNMSEATFVEGGSAVVLDSDNTLFDKELSNGVDTFENTTLSLYRTLSSNGQDVFSGTGLLGALTEGGGLVYNSVTVGTVTNNSAGTLLLTFNAAADNDDVNNVIRAIAYSNSGEAPSASVQIDWIFNDNNNAGAQGSGGDLLAAASTIVTITAVNDAPVASTIEAMPLAYTENQGPVGITSTLAISDIDDTNLESAVVQITANHVVSEDILTFLNQNGISGSWNAAAGELSLTGQATVVQYEAALRSITYSNSSESPNTLTRTVSFTVNDGNANSNTQSRDIAITSVNDAPTGVVTIDNTSPDEGDVLTASNTLADNDGLGTISYQWQRDGVDVVGAAGNTYTTVQADVDTAIRVVASYTDGDGTAETVSSTSTAAVENLNDAPTGTVTIDNTTPDQGDVLTASNNLADEDGLGTISYQWQRDGVNILGAVKTTYTTIQADVGSAFQVVASYTDAQGTPESVTSTATAPVGNVNDSPTGTVTIDNTTPDQGDVLTASNNLADEDGLGTITYQWQRDGLNISGATNTTYTTIQADVGTAIQVVASYTDAQGTSESVASTATAAVGNVNDAPTGTVTIDNTTPDEGDVLTASNTLADEDGLGTITYQWQRDGVNISGATNTTYTTIQTDVGSTVQVVASYTDGQGTSESVTSTATVAIGNVNDVPTGTVTIDSTTPNEGDILTASNTLADEDGLGTITYQWQRDGVNISGATNTTYTTIQADVGTAIQVVASYTDAQGTSESVASTATAAVGNVNDSPTGTVTIDNTTPDDGDVLTASNTLADEDGLGAITYQWQRDGVNISGATNTTYTTIQTDVGSTVQVVASYTDGQGTSESVTSTATAAVGNVNDAPTGTVTIDNTAPDEGEVLTASNTLADEDGLGTITYQWQRDGVNISGATNTTYTTIQADVGTVIQAVASYTDSQGTPESVTSTATAAVGNVNDSPTGTVTIDNTMPDQGDVLTASNTLADEDGLGTISYQWQRDGVDISGATNTTYTTIQTDVGSTVQVVASYTDGQGTSESVTSTATVAVGNVNDIPTGTVTIDSTTPNEGDILTASNTLADEDGLGTITYQWQRDGVNISGATNTTYTTIHADVGTAIQAVASYTDSQGTPESVTSTATAAVGNVNDSPTGAVTIDNTIPDQGDVLTASNTLADEDGLGTVSYQWQRDGVDISSATNTSYTTVQADVGAVIRVVASYTDDQGTPESVSSSATAAVGNVNDVPTGTVTIDSTTPNEGDILTASNTLADEDGLGTVSYQWQRDGLDISGATNTIYTTVQTDVGSVVRVVASYTDNQGTPESVSSSATAAVGNVNDAPTGTVTIDNTAPDEGDVLTASNTLADEDGMGAITYQWQRDGVDISSATNMSYTTVQADVGVVIRVVASYTDNQGMTESVSSTATAPVGNVNDSPTGTVTIDNAMPGQGDVLTASNTLADEDGLEAITYQWQRDGVNITGATNTTYTMIQADVGTAIQVVASYTDSQGTSESLTSTATAAVGNVNDAPTGAVTIDNTAPDQGDALTASNTLADEDGLGTVSYQWQRDGLDISGATNTIYTTVQTDVGSVVRVVASYTDNQGTAESVSSAATAAVGNVNDAPTGAVTIDNTTPDENDVLTASNNLADEDGLGIISYQWQRDGVNITGAMNTTYTTIQADVGTAIQVVASYTDSQGTPESVTSTATAAVGNVNDSPTGTVTIDNTAPDEGDVLTASNTLADEDGLGAITYQWQRDGVDISSATNTSYTTVQADVGVVIRVVASYTDNQGMTESVSSAATAAVGNVNDAPTGTVTIDNTAPDEGDVLTASNTLADEDGLGTITYQWQRDSVDILGATNTTYTTVQADVGAVIRVVASYTDDQGTAESVSSAATAAVGNVNDAPTGTVKIDNTAPDQGDVLTASNTLADQDGLGTISYQWQRGGVDITGATNMTYITVQTDVGAEIQVVASYTDSQGTPESVTSTATAAVGNVNDSPTGAVTIDNTAPDEGDVLTASNTLADEDGLGAITYQWQRDGVDISSATNMSYTTVQADVGVVIRVVASYTDNQGMTESVTSTATVAVGNVNDVPTGTVTIDSTTPNEGDILTASNTLADEDGLGTITYQWQRDGVNISGATNTTYTTIQADVGTAIQVVASYTDSQGTPESVASTATAAVGNVNDAPTGAVTIDNTAPDQGDVLTASNTLADEDGLGPISYQWQRDGVDIIGATSATYTTIETDVGSTLRVVASYNDAQGTPESVSSATTANIANVNDAPVIISDGGGATASVSVDENQTSVTTVMASDEDAGATQSYSLSGGLDQAAFTIDAGTGVLTFNVAPDYEIKNTFEVKVTVTDNDGLTMDQFLTINVQDVNEIPTAQTDTLEAIDNRVLTIDPLKSLLSNDTDPEQGVLTLVSFSQPRHGTLTLTTSGMMEYEPDDHFVGLDSFDYEVMDSGGNVVSARVFLDVKASNDEILGLGSPTLGAAQPVTNEVQEALDANLENVASIQLGAVPSVFTPLISQETTDDVALRYGEPVVASASNVSNAYTTKDALSDSEFILVTEQMGGSVQHLPSTTARLGASTISALLQTVLDHKVSDMDAVFELNQNEQYRSIELIDAIFALRNQIDQMVEKSSNSNPLVTLSPTVVGASLTAGVVTWILRSGLLISTTLTAAPLWRPLDTVAILTRSDDEEPWFEADVRDESAHHVTAANDPDNQDRKNG
ncbi:DUF4347 domain-containing protein [Granulosicoccus antarcticus]|uniref:Uncharacterized protein n=1 Tax=Granulosicoccus antarcticus IMCC3135 TaxID=1192854 RepID=A0A2Z2NR28_9GAMM|nr:DUF4347 domain-containing protein [Granulosicoccus antarcticus]ASJ73793.1 hypothetical protein IMCC3135_18570 [Granulosicoccus antarcticus IMCC3135]